MTRRTSDPIRSNRYKCKCGKQTWKRRHGGATIQEYCNHCKKMVRATLIK